MKKGFTLIELLTVISIISLMASVVLSSVNSAREKGRIAAGMQLDANILHGIGDQLIGEWKFNDGSGLALDSSSFGNNGIVMNNPFWFSNSGYDGKGSYTFGSGSCGWVGFFPRRWVCSSGSYINLNNPQNLYLGDTDFTISAWVNYSSSAQGGTIFSEGTTNGAAGQQIRFRVNEGGNLELNFSGSSAIGNIVPANKWTHVAVTYTRATTQATLYINGVADQTASMGSILSFTKSQTICASISKNCASGAADYSGSLDNIRLYSARLTAMNIQKQYVEGFESHRDLAVK